MNKCPKQDESPKMSSSFGIRAIEFCVAQASRLCPLRGQTQPRRLCYMGFQAVHSDFGHSDFFRISDFGFRI